MNYSFICSNIAESTAYMCSNIPASPAYGVYISQLIRYAMASSNYSEFLKRHLHLRNRLLDQGYKEIRLIRSLKKFIFRYQDLVEIYSVSAEKIIVFDIYFAELGADLTTVLPLLFKYCCKYCYSDSRETLSRNERGRFGALKSDSTHHFFRNACTKSGSLRFSQFSGS